MQQNKLKTSNYVVSIFILQLLVIYMARFLLRVCLRVCRTVTRIVKNDYFVYVLCSYLLNAS